MELWDRHDQHIRWVVTASSSVAIGHAALDTAIANYPDQRFTLRNGIQVIRQRKPGVLPIGGDRLQCPRFESTAGIYLGLNQFYRVPVKAGLRVPAEALVEYADP